MIALSLSGIDFIGKELDDALHTTIKQVKKSKGNKEALLKQVNRVLFTDFRVPTIQTVSKTGKGKQTTLVKKFDISVFLKKKVMLV